ncbi:hypothetical protein L1987_25139 [Smallanthus sonchifolius]|uniref:Uncharacterized protein n=1 Tax=Smallanthus sonchifolius TaxID=185202 RepID=A0ACB9ILM8_9ASTR|nr:hypothetical protein L1987_25139 [Smallanthus sonchifolius]
MANKHKSISICSSSTSSQQPSLELSISKTLTHPSSITISILANDNLPISLWTSKPLKSTTNNTLLHEQVTISKLLTNIIKDILNYTPIKLPNAFLNLPQPNSIPNLKDIANFLFLALAFIVSIYEAPQDIRCDCINTFKDHFACSWARETSKRLMRLIGSNAEEQWMRSMNLAITNLLIELRAMNHVLKAPSSMYYLAISGLGLWKIQLYCPVIAMEIEKCNNNGQDDQKLGFSLNYHQVEGVIQLDYQVTVREKWIDVLVSIDNVRCDVIRLVNQTLMKERGAGIGEKHFPSRISLHLTPTMETNVISVSCALLKPKAWFRNRYSSAYRPFTRQGGVVFARDEYGESVLWKVGRDAVGSTMEWEAKGWIWLTY